MSNKKIINIFRFVIPIFIFIVYIVFPDFTNYQLYGMKKPGLYTRVIYALFTSYPFIDISFAIGRLVDHERFNRDYIFIYGTKISLDKLLGKFAYFSILFAAFYYGLLSIFPFPLLNRIAIFLFYFIMIIRLYWNQDLYQHLISRVG